MLCFFPLISGWMIPYSPLFLLHGFSASVFSLFSCFCAFLVDFASCVPLYIIYNIYIPLFCPFQAIAILVFLACRACLASSRFASVACCSSCFSPCFGLGRRFVSSLLLGFANPLPKAASTGTTTAARTATTLFFGAFRATKSAHPTLLT